MKYIVRSSDGSEYGPVDQDVLLQWVNSGRVTTKTEIRNTLMKAWTSSMEIPFLAEALNKRANVVVESGEKEFQGPKKAIHSLLHTGAFKYVPANPLQRLMAWSFDMGICLTVTLALFMTCHILISVGGEDMAAEVRGGLIFWSTAGSVFFFLAYYLIGFGFKAQTIGQWFWGIMVVGGEGDPVYPFRALIYLILHIMLLPLTPLAAIMPERRALQELLTGVRIVKITVRD
jgi:uncharacterized RDD family membrane protein YckC